MKRYGEYIDWNYEEFEMMEDPDGEWVKYSDVEKEMKKIWGDIMPPPSDILKSLIKGA